MSEPMQIDPMEFLALVIEDQIAVKDAMLGPEMGDMGAVAGFGEDVAEMAHRQIEQAQIALDALIAEDTTWQPSYETECVMVYDGADPEDGDYYRCTTHGFLVLGDAYVCAGYQRKPYDGGH